MKRFFRRGDENAKAVRAQFESIPKFKLKGKHTEGCIVLPNRLALLPLLPSEAAVAEIGVAEGDLSAEILRQTNPRKLFLIDAWQGDRYGPKLKLVTDRFAADIERKIVQLRQGLSVDEIKKFDDDCLDWVYLDTDHSYETTLSELRLVQKKVRSAGFIAGHDFSVASVTKPLKYGVIFACHQFCVEENWRYAYLTLDENGIFSFCLTRI